MFLSILSGAQVLSSEKRRFPGGRRPPPPHRSKIATATREESGLEFLPWPVQSPDLNPIENLWSEVKKVVYSRPKKPKNLEEMEKAAKTAWKAIPIERI